MAVTTVTLQAVTNRRKPPYAEIIRAGVATSDFVVYGGKVLDIPNCWELLSANVNYVATAGVANRIVKFRLRGAATGTYPYDSISTAAITASQNKVIGINRIGEYSTLGSGYDQVAGIRCGAFRILDTIDYFWIVVTDYQAGDIMNINLRFRWLNWELGLDDPYPVAPAPPGRCGI